MRARTSPTKLLALVAGILVGAGSNAEAQTATDCTAGTNVVIVDGDSAVGVLLKDIAVPLSQLATPINLVFKGTGSCGGVQTFTDNLTLTGSAIYWDSTGAQQTCNLPTAGVAPDISMGGVSPNVCAGLTIPASGFGDFLGPVNTWMMIVPPGSTQQSISAKANYFIYGMGPAAANVAPWTDLSQLWGRAVSSGTLTSVALASHLDPTRLAANFLDSTGTPTAQQLTSEGSVRDHVAAATALGQDVMNKTLGFVSATIADPARAMVRTLAFEAWDQSCGYYPDNSLTSFDKVNVRDGHYDLWTNYHFNTYVDAGGNPLNANVKTLLDYLTKPESAPMSLHMLEAMVHHALTPTCAMHVQRSQEPSPTNGLGALMSVPANHEFCDGFFEVTATGSTTHAACTVDGDCTGKSVSGVSTPVCHLGYCEVQ